MNLTGCKASAYLIFAHKWFFQGKFVTNWLYSFKLDVVLQYVLFYSHG